jgi:hypothetical protein
MNERKQLLLILESAAVAVVFASLWAIGGSEDFFGGQKWIRRYLGTGLFGIWAFLRSGFNWRHVIQMGLMMGASTIPYGADYLWEKWLWRSVAGSGCGLATASANLLSKKWLLSGFHFFLCIASSIVFGVYNPFGAMWEQFFLGFVYIFIPALSVTMFLRRD